MTARMVRPVLLLLVALWCGSAGAVDTKRFEILKGVHYYQIGNGVVLLQTNNMYRFSAQVYADVVGNVLGSSIYTPVHPRIDLVPDNDGNPFAFKDKFDGEAEFEGSFPNGTYSLGIRGAHDGDHTMAFTLTGNVYPSVPVVNDYEGLQDLVYNLYNEISWQPFVGGTTNDFIQVQIEDQYGGNAWETPDFGEDGALDGLATRTIVTAGTLAPGVVYTGTIRFVKALYHSSPDYPGALGTVGYFKRVQFTIRTKTIRLERVVDRLQFWRTLRYEQLLQGELTAQVVPWEFESKLDAVSSNQVSAVSLSIPGRTNSLAFELDDPKQFDFSESYLTNKAAFLVFFPSAPYTFDIERAGIFHDRPVVNVPAGDFPSPPTLRGYQTFAGHPGGQDLTVMWDQWTNAIEPDFIRVELWDDGDKIWDTPSYSSPKHLRPTATSVTIPGTNFIFGHEMQLEVHFYHVNASDTQIIPGALVFGGFDTRTKLVFTNQFPDVVSFGVAEGRYFLQRGETTYEPDVSKGPYRFEANAIGAKTNSVSSAVLTTPSGSTISLSRNASGGGFSFIESQALAQSVANNYPTGIYTFRFETVNDGLRGSSVGLLVTGSPQLPRVRNLAALGAKQPNDPIEISFDPWVGANLDTDHIRLTIQNAVGTLKFDSDGQFSDPISATNNVVEIKKDTMVEHQIYTGRLRFERRLKYENATYPGARGTATVFSETAFMIAAFPNFRFTPRPSLLPSRDMRFTITDLIRSRTYRLSASPDMTNWTPFYTWTVTNSATSLTFTNPPTLQQSFFRTELLP